MRPHEDEKGRRWYYFDDGSAIPSVTTCIAHLNGSFWNEDEYGGMDPINREIALLEGAGCHAACLDWFAMYSELQQEAELPPCPENHPIPERWSAVISNALNTFQEFVEYEGIIAIAVEEPELSRAYGFAGEPDAKIRYRKNKKQSILELKFAKKLIRSNFIQVGCYQKLYGYTNVQDGILLRIDKMKSVYEREKVIFSQYAADVAAVAHVAALYQWGRQNGF